jgi:hypothetical protein
MKPGKGILGQASQRRRSNARRALLHHLAKRGGGIFGAIPQGVRREFFCLDERTWVWHEEWHDAAGQHHAMTTRYDVRPDGILKSQGAHSYQRLSGDEERNFRAAVKAYGRIARSEIDQLLRPIS